jgi:hypothetical protein
LGHAKTYIKNIPLGYTTIKSRELESDKSLFSRTKRTWDANSEVASDTDIDMDTNNGEHEPMKIRYSINKKGESMNGMHPIVGQCKQPETSFAIQPET